MNGYPSILCRFSKGNNFHDFLFGPIDNRVSSLKAKDLLLQGEEPTSRSGPEVIKLFSCSTQLSMNFFLLINVKMPTIVGILTFMSRKNIILGLSEPKKR